VRLFRLLASLALLLHSGAFALHGATTVPFNYADGMIWVKVDVAGDLAPLNFLLDSGAGTSVLDLATARRLAVKLGRAKKVLGVSGSAVAYRVDFVSSLASLPAPRSLLALDLTAVSRGLHQRIDGLLGADFFRGRIVQIDYAAGKLRLLDRNELTTTNAQVLPLTRRNDALGLPASIADRRAEWMRLDTGCSSSVEWVLDKSKPVTLRRPSIAASNASRQFIEADVTLGTHRFSDVKVGIHPKALFPGENGLLGNGLLSHFVVTIDADRSQLLLTR
jgi:hypothetical protein